MYGGGLAWARGTMGPAGTGGDTVGVAAARAAAVGAGELGLSAMVERQKKRGRRGKSIGFDANWLIAEIMSRVGVHIRGLWWLWVPKNVELIVLWV